MTDGNEADEKQIQKTRNILGAIIISLSSSADAVVDVARLESDKIEFTVHIPKHEAGRVIGIYGVVIK